MEGEVQVNVESEVMESPGFFTRFVNIFVNPHKTFVALDRKPSWLIPMIIVILIAIAFTFITYSIIMQNQMDALRNNPNISAEQLEVIEQQLAESGGMQKYLGIGSQLIIIPVIYLVSSGIFYFVGSVLLAGKASFVKVLSVWTWSALISVLATIVKTPLVFLKENIKISISPALLLPGEAIDSVLYKILSQFDFFLIWQLAVFAYGFGLIYRFSTGKAYTTVGVLWVIYIVIAVVASSVFKGFGMM